MIIDCHQHVGSLGQLLLDEDAEAADLGDTSAVNDAVRRREHMDRFGIDRCVVMPSFEYTTRSGGSSISKVNDSMAAYADQNDFVVAAAGIVDPLAMTPTQQVDEIRRLSRDHGARAMVWHNRFQRVPINAPVVRQVIGESQDHMRIHAIHCVAESELEAPWRLFDLARRFPDLRFLALSSMSGFSQCEEIMFHMQYVDNVFVDTAAMLSIGDWVERFVKKIGSSRLLLGTDLYLTPDPFYDSSALNKVMTSTIPEDEKEAVLGGNIAALFA